MNLPQVPVLVSLVFQLLLVPIVPLILLVSLVFQLTPYGLALVPD